MSVSSLFYPDNPSSLYCRNLTVTGQFNAHLLSNEGGGAEVYDEATNGALRTLEGTTNGLSVAQTGDTITIDNTLTGANLMPGGVNLGRVFGAKVGDELQFRVLEAGLNVTLTETATSIIVDTNGLGPGLSGVANEGGGAEVFDYIMGTTAVLRTLLGSANGLTVTQGATAITVDNTLAGSNLGAGSQLYSGKSGAYLQFRSLVAGSNIALTQNADDVTITTTGVLTALANEGGGAEVWDSGTAATLRTLLGTANGLTVTQGATAITVDNTLTGSNLGAGSQLFTSKSGASLQFRSLVAGANIALTQNTNDVTIAATGVVTTLANEGGGAQVWDSGTAATLRTLLGTANGLTVTQGATAITVDNTLTGSNLGAGSQLFTSKSGASLQFRSLVAGSNIVLTQNTNDVTISASAVPTLLDTQTFTASGTWTKPAGASYVNVLLIGGGGGGGSGRLGATSTQRTTGQGGAGGTAVRAFNVPISLLPSASYAVTVGTGGGGGASQSTTSTDGNSGSSGVATSFSFLSAPGGAGGAGGGAVVNSNTSAGTVANTAGTVAAAVDLDYAYGPSPANRSVVLRYRQVDATARIDSLAVNVTNEAVSAGYNQVCTYRVLTATNGTTGSSINASNAAVAPVAPPAIIVPGVAYTAPPAAVSGNTAGNSGSTFASYYGYGGAGSSWTSGGSTFAGGNGGLYGGGGGGGAAATNAVANSSPGGSGADGIVVVWAFG